MVIHGVHYAASRGVISRYAQQLYSTAPEKVHRLSPSIASGTLQHRQLSMGKAAREARAERRSLAGRAEQKRASLDAYGGHHAARARRLFLQKIIF